MNVGLYITTEAHYSLKAGGKYVFVTGGKVYNIADQDLGDLQTHAGHTGCLGEQRRGELLSVMARLRSFRPGVMEKFMNTALRIRWSLREGDRAQASE